MGKNKNSKFKAWDAVHDIKLEVDSAEEVDFIEWLNEAHKMKIIIDFEYQPESIVLFDGVDYESVDGKKRCLFRDHVYSPDFLVVFDALKFIQLAKEFKVQRCQMNKKVEVLIDIKGTFARNDGGRSFSLNQKWVYQKTGKYVCKIVPKDFFQKFGVPEECRVTKKTKKPRKMYDGMKSLKESFQM